MGGLAGEEVDETALTEPLLDPQFYAGDPFPLYARLRAEAPVARNDTLGMWMVSRHAEVVADLPRSGHLLLVQGDHGLRDRRRVPDPADHDAHRPARPHPLPDAGPARVPAHLHAGPGARHPPAGPGSGGPDRVRACRSTSCADLAVPLPLQVISDLLGVPEEEWPTFFRWSEAVIPGATDWPEEERDRAERGDGDLPAGGGRRPPRSSRATTSSASWAQPRSRATASPMRSSGMFLVQLLVAGNETTRNMMSGGLVGFAEHPGQWEALAGRADAGTSRALPARRRGDAALDHPGGCLHAHHHPRGRARRTPARAGEPVLMLYASANRDETVFGPTADRFDAARDPNPHVAFGFGAHFCIGAVLARVEGRIMLEELLARFGSLDPAGLVDALRPRSSPGCALRLWCSGRGRGSLSPAVPLRPEPGQRSG